MNAEEYNIQLLNELIDGIDAGDFNVGTGISDKYRYEHLAALFTMAPYLDGGEQLYNQIYDIVMQQAVTGVKNRIKAGEKLKIYFLVISAAEWSAGELYRKFEKNSNIECKVVVCPLVDRDKESMRDSYFQTREFFMNNGYDVLEGYDFDKDEILFFDPKTEGVDVVVHLTSWFMSMPEAYRITSFPLSIVNCYIPYGMYMANSPDNSYVKNYVYNKEFINMQLRVYADSEKNVQGYRKYGMLHGKNVVCSGYIKMDYFYNDKTYTDEEVKKLWKIPDGKGVKDVKKVIIAPHHSIKGYGGIRFATFQQNAHYLYYLAKKYSDGISFVLKPHPSLRVRAVEAKVFESYEEYDAYIDKWNSLPNAKVVQDGDYTNIFRTSDGMIMDSASFLGEYLYLNKPLLFLQRNGQAFNELAEAVMDSYYKAKGTEYADIEDFLKQVVLEENDEMKELRKQIFEKELDYYAKNGCMACDTIYNDIISVFQAE